jgi:hypothetical protein
MGSGVVTFLPYLAALSSGFWLNCSRPAKCRFSEPRLRIDAAQGVRRYDQECETKAGSLMVCGLAVGRQQLFITTSICLSSTCDS